MGGTNSRLAVDARRGIKNTSKECGSGGSGGVRCEKKKKRRKLEGNALYAPKAAIGAEENVTDAWKNEEL